MEGMTVISNYKIMQEKDYGFMVFEPQSQTVYIIQSDSVEEYADDLGFEEEDVKPLFELRVGESLVEDVITTRIW